MKQLLAGRSGPASMVTVINAGSIPSDHWLRNMGSWRWAELSAKDVTGFDFMSFLVGQSIHSVARTDVASETNYTDDDSATVTLKFADGSNGNAPLSRERQPQFSERADHCFQRRPGVGVRQLRTLHSWGWSGVRRMKLWSRIKDTTAKLPRSLMRVSGGTPRSDEFA